MNKLMPAPLAAFLPSVPVAIKSIAETALCHIEDLQLDKLKLDRHRLSTLACGLIGIAACVPALAGFELDLDGGNKLKFGGYVKADARHVNGDIAYQDYWVANFPGGAPVDTSHTGFNIKESRVNVTYIHGDVTGFVEWDFYGGGGNEVVSNSSNPRLRHFKFNYKNWMVGQTWSTFMPLAALPEALDFGGPHVGEAFARQVQVRYTRDGLEVALENPETNGDGDVGTPAGTVGVTGDQADSDESTPDLIARYTFKGEWGELSLAGLARKVDQGGLDETAVAGNVSGRIHTVGNDDLRFQASFGEPGRYVSAALTPDIVVDPANDQVEVEETTAFTLAYRHFWTDTLRSTAFYGTAETDILERDRAHWGINLIGQITPGVTAGFEVGNYSIDDNNSANADSNYYQFSARYTF